MRVAVIPLLLMLIACGGGADQDGGIPVGSLFVPTPSAIAGCQSPDSLDRALELARTDAAAAAAFLARTRISGCRWLSAGTMLVYERPAARSYMIVVRPRGDPDPLYVLWGQVRAASAGAAP